MLVKFGIYLVQNHKKIGLKKSNEDKFIFYTGKVVYAIYTNDQILEELDYLLSTSDKGAILTQNVSCITRGNPRYIIVK